MTLPPTGGERARAMQRPDPAHGRGAVSPAAGTKPSERLPDLTNTFLSFLPKVPLILYLDFVLSSLVVFVAAMLP